MHRVVVIAVPLLTSLLVPAAGASHIDSDEFRKGCPFSEDEWEEDVYDCGGRIPSIQNPTFGDGTWLEDGDVVIGIAQDGVAKAYPIAILNWHEIVNDRIAGEPVVVSYCPLCASSVAYERTVDGQVLTFHVSGYLFRSDLVMVDEETHSLWPQIEGTASRGPLHGTDLALYPSETVGWGDWKERHPDTLVLERPRCGDGSTENRQGCRGEFQRDYDRNPYGGYGNTRDVGVSGQSRGDVEGLHPKDHVLGLETDQATKAYPLFLLSEQLVVNDEIGDTPVVVAWAGSDAYGYIAPEGTTFRPGDANGTMVDDQGRIYDITTGTSDTGPPMTALAGLDLFWFAWLDHHPQTQLYTSNGTVTIDHDPPKGTPGPGIGGALLAIAGAAVWAARRWRPGGSR